MNVQLQTVIFGVNPVKMVSTIKGLILDHLTNIQLKFDMVVTESRSNTNVECDMLYRMRLFITSF